MFVERTNVLIYFSTETKRDILNKMSKLLRPDGYLALGSTETTLNINETLKRKVIGKTVFYQIGQ